MVAPGRAAAVIAGVKRQHHANNGPLSTFRDHRDRSRECNTGVVAGCLGSFLAVIGLGVLLWSFNDERDELIHEYHNVVDDWTSTWRPYFAGVTMNVTTVFSADPKLGSAQTILPSVDAEPSFKRDSENGIGLPSYSPLKFSASLASGIPPSRNFSEEWSPLPSLDTAPRITVSFRAAAENGLVSEFAATFPLLFDDTVPSVTPAPEMKCSGQQQGTWHNGRCHVAKRLASLCWQIERNSTGKIAMRPKDPSVRVRSAVPSYFTGCYYHNSWHPAVYVSDSCWGRTSTRCRLNMENDIKLMLRSTEDPFIYAQTLTQGTLDFGMAAETWRVLGIVILLSSSVIVCFLIARYYGHKHGRKHSDEDTRSLRYAREDSHISDVDVYGHHTK